MIHASTSSEFQSMRPPSKSTGRRQRHSKRPNGDRTVPDIHFSNDKPINGMIKAGTVPPVPDRTGSFFQENISLTTSTSEDHAQNSSGNLHQYPSSSWLQNHEENDSWKSPALTREPSKQAYYVSCTGLVSYDEMKQYTDLGFKGYRVDKSTSPEGTVLVPLPPSQPPKRGSSKIKGAFGSQYESIQHARDFFHARQTLAALTSHAPELVRQGAVFQDSRGLTNIKPYRVGPGVHVALRLAIERFQAMEPTERANNAPETWVPYAEMEQAIKGPGMLAVPATATIATGERKVSGGTSHDRRRNGRDQHSSTSFSEISMPPRSSGAAAEGSRKTSSSSGPYVKISIKPPPPSNRPAADITSQQQPQPQQQQLTYHRPDPHGFEALEKIIITVSDEDEDVTPSPPPPAPPPPSNGSHLFDDAEHLPGSEVYNYDGSASGLLPHLRGGG